ncbi:hypothetical protein Tco_1128782 [Tanacetum coccineum]
MFEDNRFATTEGITRRIDYSLIRLENQRCRVLYKVEDIATCLDLKKENEGNKDTCLFTHVIHHLPSLDDSKLDKILVDADDEFCCHKRARSASAIYEYNIDACQAYQAAIWRILEFGIWRLDSLYRPYCKEIDELVTVYSRKRRVLNSYRHSDASSTHFCSRTQIGESSRAKYQGISLF